MKFESKFELNQLVEFTKEVSGEPDPRVQVGVIRAIKFRGQKEPAYYEIEVLNVGQTAQDVLESEIQRAFRSTT